MRISAPFALLTCMAVAGCADSPAAPTPPGPPIVFPSPPVVLVEVPVTGQIVDRDRQVPIAGVRVRLDRVVGAAVPETAPAVETDADGRFSMTFQLIDTWRSIALEVTREGHEPARTSFIRDELKPFVLGMYPTLRIRPGESLDTGLVDGRPGADGSYYCGFGIDEEQCRRIVVDAPAGEPVEIDLVPHGGLEVIGLIDAPQQPANAPFVQRITVTRGEVWLAGNFGAVTLRASSR